MTVKIYLSATHDKVFAAHAVALRRLMYVVAFQRRGQWRWRRRTQEEGREGVLVVRREGKGERLESGETNQVEFRQTTAK